MLLGFKIAMDQAAFVRSLKAAAGLGNDVDRALYRQTMAGFANEIFQRCAWQQRHHEVRFLLAFFFEFPDIKNLDDVGMAHRSQHIAFFVEQLERSWIGNVEDGFHRDFAAHYGVVGAIDKSHAALAEDLPDLVAACQFFRRRGNIHGAPRFGGHSILIDLA